MEIYIIRHGQTDWNKAYRLQGRSDIPLNEEGRRLARKTAEALQDVPFARAYTSPLARACETAKILLAGRDVPVVEDPRLLEIGFGVYEGRISRGEGYNVPDRKFDWFFTAPDRYMPPPGGESISQLCVRTTAFLRELIHTPSLADKTVLVSTHGAAVRGLLSTVNMEGPGDFWHGKVQKNCAVSVLSVQNGKMILRQEGAVYY